MNFVWFEGKRIAINLDNVEWYSVNQNLDFLRLRFVSGDYASINDTDEIEAFLELVVLMEFEDEAEEE